MRRIIKAALFLSVPMVFGTVFSTGCANQPDRPAEYVTPKGEHMVLTMKSSAVSGSVHLYINSKRAASGSFGMLAGSTANGKGRYRHQRITFFCKDRYSPHCLIYRNGEKIAEIDI